MSAPPPLQVKFGAPSHVRNLVKQGLLNSGIPFDLLDESEQEIHIQVPSTFQKLSVLLHLIHANSDSIDGELTGADGKVYRLDKDGIATLQELLVKAMTQPQPSPPPLPANLWWLYFLPELRGVIKEIAGLIRWYPRATGAGRQSVARNLTILIAGIVIGVGILTYLGRISGDAFVFVIGILLGYVFSFLQRFLGLAGAPE